MPLWVAPSVAAEIWGVSLQHVLSLIGSNQIPHKEEMGFKLVDAYPDTVPPAPVVTRGPTFKDIVEEETESCVNFLQVVQKAKPAVSIDHADDPALQFDWRRCRFQVGQRRKPPVALAG